MRWFTIALAWAFIEQIIKYKLNFRLMSRLNGAAAASKSRWEFIIMSRRLMGTVNGSLYCVPTATAAGANIQ